MAFPVYASEQRETVMHSLGVRTPQRVTRGDWDEPHLGRQRLRQEMPLGDVQHIRVDVHRIHALDLGQGRNVSGKRESRCATASTSAQGAAASKRSASSTYPTRFRRNRRRWRKRVRRSNTWRAPFARRSPLLHDANRLCGLSKRNRWLAGTGDPNPARLTTASAAAPAATIIHLRRCWRSKGRRREQQPPQIAYRTLSHEFREQEDGCHDAAGNAPERGVEEHAAGRLARFALVVGELGQQGDRLRHRYTGTAKQQRGRRAIAGARLNPASRKRSRRAASKGNKPRHIWRRQKQVDRERCACAVAPSDDNWPRANNRAQGEQDHGQQHAGERHAGSDHRYGQTDSNHFDGRSRSFRKSNRPSQQPEKVSC